MRKNRQFDLATVSLFLVLGFIVFCIISGTVWAFATGNVRIDKKRRSLFSPGSSNPSKEEIAEDSAGKTAVFADIGVLRAITGDKVPVTVIVSPFLPYPAADIAFQEELVQKTRIMRTSILGWFRSRSIADISKLGEAGVKAELIELINSNLVLGQISVLFFEEYLVL